MIVNLIAWLVLGAIAGYVAGLLVKGDESLGVIGHVVLGIVGAIVGGFLASLLGLGGITNEISVPSIVIAVIGAVIVVVVWGMISGGRRVGRGPI